MPGTPDKRTQLTLADLAERFADRPAPQSFERIYEDDLELGHVFAVFHAKLNEYLNEINGRARTTGHYRAENSRALLSVIAEVEEVVHELRRAGISIELNADYRQALEGCKEWLQPSGGSPVPEDFATIELVRHEPVFSREAKTAKLIRMVQPELKMVAEGSFARVYSYIDPNYGARFAIKRAKPGLAPRDLERFKNEFKVMAGLRFPYILRVFRFDDQRNEYSMEFCDATLRAFVKRHNNSLTFAVRKRIALQFLYGMAHLHSKSLLHRDVSLQNVLVQEFEGGAVLVKLSDFGLVKDSNSDFTLSQTEMKGTIRDPTVTSFKDYEVVNEMYAIGHVLSYIFTGRESLKVDNSPIGRIVDRCVAHDVAQRYSTVIELIGELESAREN